MWSLLVPLAFASQALGGVTSSFSAANNKTFDYIVVGGGLTGITVASRLAENPAVTVLVVEAGADNRQDPRVFDMYRYSEAFGSELDWQWTTELNKKMIGGKTLGGGSAINGGAYTRGLNASYDVWSQLLETSEASVGWNWQGLWNYMKKSERFSPPNAQQAAAGAQYIENYHGFNGPVETTFLDPMYTGPQQKSFAQTIVSLTGIKWYKDINGGTPNAVSMTPITIDWRAGPGRRSDATTAYLTPVESQRTNWITLVNHQVTKVRFNTGAIPLVANGIEFAPSAGGATRYVAFARKEVIMAAGTIATPAILQLSGIGDSAVLGPLGITTRIDLKTVGKNLQEQTIVTAGADAVPSYNPGGTGQPNCIAFPNIYQLFGSGAAASVQKIANSLSAWATSQAGNALNAAALRTIFGLQQDLIVNKNAPVAEMFFSVGYPDDLGFLLWQLLPFSRGNVKITSTNPFTRPAVTINYFSVDWDLDVQVAASKLARRVYQTSPMSTLVARETTPSFTTVPSAATEEQWRTWVRGHYGPVAHPVGSCAMMRRNLGGVVNAQLKVYDTANLRIVDASVMPTQISAHLSATLYGIAEKAADLIKAAA